MIKLKNGELVGIVSKFGYGDIISVLKEFDTSNLKRSILYISLDRSIEEIQIELGGLNGFDKLILDGIDSDMGCIKNTIIENINKIGFVIIDYFSLIKLKNEDNISTIWKYSKISRELKLLTLNINKPIIVKFYVPDEVNLHNNVYPDLHDMRIFGAAESDVDLVISQFYCEGKIKNKIIKNRFGDDN